MKRVLLLLAFVSMASLGCQPIVAWPNRAARTVARVVMASTRHAASADVAHNVPLTTSRRFRTTTPSKPSQLDPRPALAPIPTIPHAVHVTSSWTIHRPSATDLPSATIAQARNTFRCRDASHQIVFRACPCLSVDGPCVHPQSRRQRERIRTPSKISQTVVVAALAELQ